MQQYFGTEGVQYCPIKRFHFTKLCGWQFKRNGSFIFDYLCN